MKNKKISLLLLTMLSFFGLFMFGSILFADNLEIEQDINNRRAYIQDIIFTNNGKTNGTTGVQILGNNGTIISNGIDTNIAGIRTLLNIYSPANLNVKGGANLNIENGANLNIENGANLEIQNGANLRIIDGNQGDGQILQSDANGNVEWNGIDEIQGDIINYFSEEFLKNFYYSGDDIIYMTGDTYNNNTNYIYNTNLTNVIKEFIENTNINNTTVNNFSHWQSGANGLYYLDNNVGVGTNNPNSNLHIKDNTGNAEIDIQSQGQNHWAIYQDASNGELRFWNAGTNNLIRLTTSGEIIFEGDINFSDYNNNDNTKVLTTNGAGDLVLTDGYLPSCANDEILKRDGADWICADDETIDEPLNCNSDEKLEWDGSSWSCEEDSLGTTACGVGQILEYNGSNWICGEDNEGSSNDTETWNDILNGAGEYMQYKPNNIACADGQVLKWNDSDERWECADDTGGSSGIETPTGCVSGQILQYDGANWICADICTITASCGGGTPGICGASHGTTITTGIAPSNDLCDQGTVTWTDSTANDGTWNWTCTDDIAVNCYANNSTSIDGDCGAADGSGFVSLNDTNPDLCLNGGANSAFTYNSGQNKWTWHCDGINGGQKDTSCEANEIVTTTTDGVCGADNNQNLYSQPTNLCNEGTASAITTNANNWTWTCNSNDGGNNANCSANKKIDATCGTANKTYTTETSYGTDTFCSIGTLNGSSPAFPTEGNTINWTCDGINTGSPANCSATKSLTPMPGVCGTADGQDLDTQPNGGSLCNGGNATPITLASNIWTWSCNGINGSTTNDNCTANQNVDGVCDTSTNGQNLTSAPTNLCNEGTASAVTYNNNTWNWTCQGIHSGNPVTCEAYESINGNCGTADGTNSYSEPTTDLCSSGTTGVISVTPTGWDWTCQGINGGTPDTCSANLSKNGVCGTANENGFVSLTDIDPNLCSVGNITSFSTGTETWSWICQGENGGTSPDCAANRIKTVDCSTSSYSILSGSLTGTYQQIWNAPSWITYTATGTAGIPNTCGGICNDANYNRDASSQTCIEGDIDGVCNTVTNQSLRSIMNGMLNNELCSVGNASSVSRNGAWEWTCDGLNSGADVTCTTDCDSTWGGASWGDGNIGNPSCSIWTP